MMTLSGLEEWSQLNKNTKKWLEYCRSGEKNSKTIVDFYQKQMVLFREWSDRVESALEFVGEMLWGLMRNSSSKWAMSSSILTHPENICSMVHN